MLDYQEIAQTISSISDLPSFISTKDGIEIVKIGFMSNTSMKNVYNLLFHSRRAESNTTIHKHPLFLRIVSSLEMSFLCAIVEYNPIKSILFGPFFLENKNEEKIVSSLCSLDPEHFTPETASHFVQSIPIKDSAFVQAWGQIISRYLGLQPKPYVKVSTYKYKQLFSSDSSSVEVSSISENRINEIEIASRYKFEQEIRTLIRQGDKEKLKQRLVPKTKNTATLAFSHSVFEERVIGNKSINAEKKLIIALNSMFKQSAFDSGLPPVYIHSISEDMNKRIEDATDRDDLFETINLMIESYCNSIINTSYHNHSVNVVKVQKYIINNKSEKITLDRLCEITGLDESYLCRLFKKECRMTINEYIHAQRTNEAKWLLSSSDTPIIEISHMLGYSSQSYFCSVFKKIVGVSPSEYRLNRGHYYTPKDNISVSVKLHDD